MDVHHYTVNYETNGGSFETDPEYKIYYYGESVAATSEKPVKDGYRFICWTLDGTDILIQPDQEVTTSITDRITLTAQWEESVNVISNVSINHEGGEGWDLNPDMDHITLTVAARENEGAPFLEVDKTLPPSEQDGFVHSTEVREFENETYTGVTRYKGYTLPNRSCGTTEYTVVTGKSGYEVTLVETALGENGKDKIIIVELVYQPTNLDLSFTVEVDKDISQEHVSVAAIVKVTFWASGKCRWMKITQQTGGKPGVRVDIDPETR